MSKAVSFTKHFKSQKLRDQFQEFVNDPHKMRLTGEMALLRVMLVQMISRTESDTLPIQHIEAITVLAEKVMGMANTISKMNQLTPEVVDNILNKAIEVLAKYLPPDRLVEAAQEIQALSNTDPKPVEPIEVGNFIEVDERTLRITSNTEDPNSIQKRTLLEEAQRLQIEIKQMEGDIADAESP